MKDLLKSSIIVMITRGIGIVLQSLIVLFLAREMPIEEMGCFSILYTVYGLSRLLGPVGTDQICMRLIARYSTLSMPQKSQYISSNCFALVLLSNVPVIIIFALATFFFSANLGLTWQEITASAVIMLSFSLMGLFAGQIRGLGRNVLAQLSESIILNGFFALGLAGAYVADTVTLKNTIDILCIASVGTIIICGVIRYRLGIGFMIRPRFKHIIELAREGVQVLQGLLFTALSAHAPVLLAAIFLGPSASAVLKIATRFGMIATIITGSVAATFSPRFSVLVVQNKKKDLSRTLSSASAIAGVPAILYVAALALSAPVLIDIVLPQSYASAYLPMLLICLAAAVNAFFGLASNLLYMSGYSQVVRNYSAVQLLVICITSATLFSSLGIVGLAMAILVGAFVRDLGLAVWVSRNFKIVLPPFDIYLWKTLMYQDRCH